MSGQNDPKTTQERADRSPWVCSTGMVSVLRAASPSASASSRAVPLGASGLVAEA